MPSDCRRRKQRRVVPVADSLHRRMLNHPFGEYGVILFHHVIHPANLGNLVV